MGRVIINLRLVKAGVHSSVEYVHKVPGQMPSWEQWEQT